MKKIITKQEYQQIIGLLYLARKAAKQIIDIEKAYVELVEYSQTIDLDCGLFGDAIWNDGTDIDEVLKKEEIIVK